VPRTQPPAAYRAARFAFDVRTDVPDPGDVVSRLFSVFGTAPPGSATCVYTVAADRARTDAFVLTTDGHVVPDVSSLGTILDWVIADATRRGVASDDRGVPLHAGAVAVDGRGVIVPGASGAGKSTLVAGLVAAGADYLSDEVAVVDPRGDRLHPFPRPLVLDPDAVDAVIGLRDRLPSSYERFRLLRHHVVPSDLRPGAEAPSAPVPIGLVIEPRYERGAPTTAERLSRAEVLYTLANHVFGEIDVVERSLDTLQVVARNVPGYRLRSGDLQDAVGAVVALAREAAAAP
jgi:hypothetical protein